MRCDRREKGKGEEWVDGKGRCDERCNDGKGKEREMRTIKTEIQKKGTGSERIRGRTGMGRNEKTFVRKGVRTEGCRVNGEKRDRMGGVRN